MNWRSKPDRVAVAENTAANHRKWLAAEYEKLDGWAGTCQKCGNSRKGTLAQLREPCGRCGHGAQTGT